MGTALRRPSAARTALESHPRGINAAPLGPAPPPPLAERAGNHTRAETDSAAAASPSLRPSRSAGVLAGSYRLLAGLGSSG